MFAYIENGVVREVCRVDSPYKIFFPDYAAKFIACPDWVEPGDLYDGEVWAKKPAPSRDILAEITELESQITIRRQREAILGTDNGWLADIDAQIAALRAQL